MFIEYLKNTAKDKIQFRLRTATFFLGKASRLRTLYEIHARARTHIERNILIQVEYLRL
jgi:hypothetical protein